MQAFPKYFGYNFGEKCSEGEQEGFFVEKWGKKLIIDTGLWIVFSVLALFEEKGALSFCCSKYNVRIPFFCVSCVKIRSRKICDLEKIGAHL